MMTFAEQTVTLIDFQGAAVLVTAAGSILATLIKYLSAQRNADRNQLSLQHSYAMKVNESRAKEDRRLYQAQIEATNALGLAISQLGDRINGKLTEQTSVINDQLRGLRKDFACRYNATSNGSQT